MKQTNNKWSISKWCDYILWKRNKEIKYPEVLHFCELYILFSLFLFNHWTFISQSKLYDQIVAQNFTPLSEGEYWYKSNPRPNEGIKLPRNNDQWYFVQGVKSPKILAEDGVRHVFDSYRNPDERMLLSLLHFRPNRCWSTLWYITCFQLNSSFFEGNANARPQLKRTTI